jgi:hypothetical protein
MLRTNRYNTKSNVLLKNRFNNETVRGDVVEEKEIDGKGFWVLYNPERGTKILLSKESFTIVKR